MWKIEWHDDDYKKHSQEVESLSIRDSIIRFHNYLFDIKYVDSIERIETIEEKIAKLPPGTRIKVSSRGINTIGIVDLDNKVWFTGMGPAALVDSFEVIDD